MVRGPSDAAKEPAYEVVRSDQTWPMPQNRVVMSKVKLLTCSTDRAPNPCPFFINRLLVVTLNVRSAFKYFQRVPVERKPLDSVSFVGVRYQTGNAYEDVATLVCVHHRRLVSPVDLESSLFIL